MSNVNRQPPDPAQDPSGRALRALAARAPYFSDGFATTALEVVRFYNLRFNIGLTSQEAQDLANYLNAL